ncbi:hypothetical protein TPA0910_00190 [Streptomyces hygroscopicus subsp. sporocinereus]|uniref:Uncharacterized protein n=1 Tax=Streptomyces hygroscopicus TaxID=1912 RepID=A0ABQ3TQH7_STRHY|nr:MFS transporter [Streptomyces hygroscopicus]GHJ25586.1 hypothetical protein TPA0910_00190 [Streptomyces hygroscopicus]
MFGIAAVPAVLFGAGMLAMPESPRWLALRGHTERARAALTRLRGPDDPAAVEAELAEAATRAGRHGGAHRPQEPLADTDLPARWRPMIVAGVGLQILGQASGVNTVIYYAPKIFESKRSRLVLLHPRHGRGRRVSTW